MDKVSNNIYKAFQKKFLLGKLAVLECSSVASLFLKNREAFSLIVIAPSGSMKSKILDDIQKIFYDETFQIPSRFTPYGLSSFPNKHLLDKRTWLINDMVRTFDTLNPVKAMELVGWLAELLSEGHAGSETAKEAKIEAKMNLIANIALVKYHEVVKYFHSSTFAERVLQYFYMLKKDDVRKKTNEQMNITDLLKEPIPKLKPTMVRISPVYKKIIYKLSDELQKLQQFEKESMRTDKIVESILCGHALLNQRDCINKRDFEFLESCFENLRRSKTN